MSRFTLVALVALGCSSGDKGGTGTDDTAGGTDDTASGGGATFDDFIDVTETATGDFTGFEGGFDAAGAWWTQSVDPEAQVTAELDAEVLDFESDEPVEATVEFWYGDVVSGVADAKSTSDTEGSVGISNVPMCTPMTYKVWTDPELDKTKDTFEAHQIYGLGEGELKVTDELNSVSVTTYRLIPSLLGVTVDDDKGIIAGTAYDINETPVEGAQVVVRDSAGNIPADLVVKYFVDDFPNRNQPYSSEDGLWVAMNIPEGTWNVEMYISDGAGGHYLMGNTVVEVFAGSINISNTFTGYGEGIRYPDSCVAAR